MRAQLLTFQNVVFSQDLCYSVITRLNLIPQILVALSYLPNLIINLSFSSSPYCSDEGVISGAISGVMNITHLFIWWEEWYVSPWQKQHFVANKISTGVKQVESLSANIPILARNEFLLEWLVPIFGK